MRTTLDLDDDALTAVKLVASATGKSAGAAASELIRRGLTETRELQERNGLILFPEPARGISVTVALIDRLHDDLP